MRILWFTNTPSLATEHLTGKVGVGGGWIESLELKLQEHGQIELAIAFPWKGEKVSTYEIGKGVYYGIPTYSPSKYKRWMDRLNAAIDDPAIVNYYLEIIESFKPDVIHIFGSERSYGLLTEHVDIPTFLWIQGNLTVYSMKWYSDITLSEVKGLTTFKDRIKGDSWIHRFNKFNKEAKREQKIFSLCKNFTGRTNWDRRLAMTMSDGANYFHVDEVMRPHFYGPEWSHHGKREKLQLFTTIRGNIYKGLNSIFHTARVLSKKNIPFEWRLAGIAPNNELVRMVEKKLNTSHKQLSIVPMGNKTPDELVSELLFADVFVHPSHIDNSPNSVCEAMLLGVPVVSTNCGGIPDLLVNEQEGLLVQAGDPYAMAGAILDVHNNPEFAKRISSAARSRGLKRNDPDKITKDLLNAYQRVLEGNLTVA
ncbi:MAG: glycosyltransferase [Bacteroidota bacterium]